jgi:GLPGLI family protein
MTKYISKNLSLFFIFFFIYSFGQKIEFKANLKVTYESELQLGVNFKKNQTFVLIGNSQDFYFAAYQNFLNDTGQYESKGFDVSAVSDYFQERSVKVNNNVNILLSYLDSKIRYDEDVDIKWIIYSETKMVAGVKCQMAATNKFGRRWIAYFSNEYKQNIGPYKFYGLPGLIMELYDTKNQYHFTVSKIEKYSKVFSFNLSPYKKFNKNDYLKAKKNLEFSGAGYPVMTGSMKKDFDERMERKKKMFNNPIELVP